MAKSKKKAYISVGTQIAMIAIPIALILLFVFFNKVTGFIFGLNYMIILPILTILFALFTVPIIRKMYKFYDVKTPILAYVPCINELCLIDYKLKNVGLVLYGIAILFAVLSFASILPENLPVTGALVSVVFLAIIQVVKGIGLMASFKDIEGAWTKLSSHNSGLLRLFVLTGFLPFVRIFLLYSMDKILTAMVTFGGYNQGDVEEEDEALNVSEDE